MKPFDQSSCIAVSNSVSLRLTTPAGVVGAGLGFDGGAPGIATELLVDDATSQGVIFTSLMSVSLKLFSDTRFTVRNLKMLAPPLTATMCSSVAAERPNQTPSRNRSANFGSLTMSPSRSTTCLA